MSATNCFKVSNLADGRLGVRGDLDEVETLLGGDAEGITDTELAKLGAVDANQAADSSGDLPVNTGTFGLCYLTHLPFPAACLAGTSPLA